MCAKYVIEWTFTPPDYFEQTTHITGDDFEMWIEEGKVKAEVKDEDYDEHHKRDELHEFLNDRFLGVQILDRRPYKLSNPSVHKLHPDGRKDVFIQVQSMVAVSRVSGVDIVQKDADGNVVVDTKKERIDKKLTISELVAKHRGSDKTLESLVRSLVKSINEPNVSLIRLYEIRDALQKKFGNAKLARGTLGISKGDWSRLGHLANEAPVRQGRHQGQHAGAVRDATVGELKEAQDIARNMIMAYLNYIESQS